MKSEEKLNLAEVWLPHLTLGICNVDPVGLWHGDKKAFVGYYEEGKCENVLRSVSTSLKSL